LLGESAGPRVIRRLYTAVLAVGLVVTAPSYLAKAMRRGTGLALRERLGHLPDHVVAAVRDRRAVWVHAVSVGEVTAAVPLLREIKIRYPTVCLFVTTVTATGRQTVVERVPQADAIAYFPLDLPSVVGRLLDTIKPRLFLCVETELWPNFLSALARRGIPAFLVNGRLNARSARRYRWARRLFQPVLAGFYGFGVQTTADAQRLAGIGADPSRIVITGNLKFDQPADDGEVDGPARRVGLGLAPDELLWVAGSTRHGEEEPLLDAYRRLRDRGIPVVLVIAPRHLDRLDKIEAMVRERGFDPVRRSALHTGQPGGRGEGDRARVILLDTIGELAALYGEAAVAFVGGTLVPVGGHNLLEPAARGKVVVFGPHTYKCEEIAAAVLESGAGVRVDSADALAEQVGRLLADPALRERMGRRGREMVARNQGAVERTLALLHPWLVE
jgi:3-deoxy-D-manno-octulosonic-acid transferase